MVAETFLRCSCCKLDKQPDDFPKEPRNTNRLGRASWCRKCKNIADAQRSARSPAKTKEKDKRNGAAYRQRKKIADPDCTRRSHLKRRFGITIEAFDALLESQGGCCAICKTPPSDDALERLSVDHDHETGEVRGILCRRCNSSLGMLRDDPMIVQRAADYLATKKGAVLSL